MCACPGSLHAVMHFQRSVYNNNNNNELYNAEAALKVQWVEIPMAMDTHIHTS